MLAHRARFRARARPEARSHDAGCLRMSYLGDVFTASEEENRQAILRAVAELGPFARVLDLGCYDGAFTARLGQAARARDVAGIELLDEHAELARAKGVDVTLAN